MPDSKPSISFQLPDRQSTEVYIVTLPDGRKVARTKEELARAPKK